MGIFDRLFGKRTPAEKNPEIKNSFEDFISKDLAKQREKCAASLRNVGLLEEIPVEGSELVIEMREGITAMDGKKYEFPSAEKIAKHFGAEKYKEKFEQGFTKLLIVPFGYPLATLRIRYEKQLLKHHREGKVLDRDGKRLELNESMSLFFLDEFDKSDETDGMVYYPKQFGRGNHGGKTKQQLLDDPQQPFPGFHVFLTKSEPTIPRVGKGKITGTRRDIETNKTSMDYLKLLKEPQYREERGFTLEDSIVLAMTHLDQTNQVIDDMQNHKDSVSFNIGNYHPESRAVPNSSWDRHSRQAVIHGFGPGLAGDHMGVRLAVG